MRPQTRILSPLPIRIAVLGARSAPKRYWQPVKGSAGYQGQSRQRPRARPFLELMIKHHAGALIMVDELFAAEGAAQQSDVFSFASEIETDQRVEIERMSAMLEEHRK